MAINFQDAGRILHKVGNQDAIFEAANQDTTSSEFQYFGYISAEGSWIIQRFHIIAAAVIYEYFAGQTIAAYTACWGATGLYVGALTFGRYDEIKDL